MNNAKARQAVAHARIITKTLEYLESYKHKWIDLSKLSDHIAFGVQISITYKIMKTLENAGYILIRPKRYFCGEADRIYFTYGIELYQIKFKVSDQVIKPTTHVQVINP